MESHNQCPKCNGEMEQGFILDHKDYASSVVAQWQQGEPQKSFWRGVQSKDGPHYEITAYRCTGCGYLEVVREIRKGRDYRAGPFPGDIPHEIADP